MTWALGGSFLDQQSVDAVTHVGADQAVAGHAAPGGYVGRGIGIGEQQAENLSVLHERDRGPRAEQRVGGGHLPAVDQPRSLLLLISLHEPRRDARSAARGSAAPWPGRRR